MTAAFTPDALRRAYRQMKTIREFEERLHVEIATASQGFYSLKAPIQLVTAPHSPVPFARELERAYVPGPARIESAIRAVMRD